MDKKQEFIEIYKRNIKIEGAEKLLNWLENDSDFFTCPASTKFHNNFEGGLCEHSINVYNRLKKLVVMAFGENYWENLKNIDGTNRTKEEIDETLAIIGLLHDICKVNTYKTDYKNVKVYSPNGSKIDNGGRFDWQTEQFYTVDDDLPYGHGEKSVYMISGFFKLSREQAMAINWHMSGFDLRVKAGSYAISDVYYKYPLALLLANADMIATYLDETIKK